jgi:hypothetical protein
MHQPCRIRTRSSEAPCIHNITGWSSGSLALPAPFNDDRTSPDTLTTYKRAKDTFPVCYPCKTMPYDFVGGTMDASPPTLSLFGLTKTQPPLDPALTASAMARLP